VRAGARSLTLAVQRPIPVVGTERPLREPLLGALPLPQRVAGGVDTDDEAKIP